jgi:uncharacterized protein
MKRLRLSLSLLAILSWSIGTAQEVTINSLFWEVSGNELQEPSYLFGTFHLEGSDFVDSLTMVKEKFEAARSFAGEIIFDSSMQGKLAAYTIMKDSTLEMILGTAGFDSTARWFNELTGMELGMYNQAHPVVVQMVLLTALQNKIYRNDSEPMDIYFQRQAKNKEKKLTGLETLEKQMDIMFNSKTLRQNGDQLRYLVKNKEHMRDSLIRMNILYHQQDIEGLYQMMKAERYYSERDVQILFARNLSWLQTLLTLFREQSTFVAVGALHLPGEEGVISLLRQHGYNVRPIPLKNQ